MFCKYCGKEIDNISKYCPYCGKELVGTSLKWNAKWIKNIHVNKWVAYFYAFWVVINFFFVFYRGTDQYSNKSLFPNCTKYYNDGWYGGGYLDTEMNFDFVSYDISDFLFYTVVVPFLLYILYLLIISFREKRIDAMKNK